MFAEQYMEALFYILAIGALLVLGRLFWKPIRLGLKLFLNAAISIAGLFILNSVGAFFGLFLAINPLTVLTCAVLGLPGLISLVTLSSINL